MLCLNLPYKLFPFEISFYYSSLFLKWELKRCFLLNIFSCGILILPNLWEKWEVFVMSFLEMLLNVNAKEATFHWRDNCVVKDRIFIHMSWMHWYHIPFTTNSSNFKSKFSSIKWLNGRGKCWGFFSVWTNKFGKIQLFIRSDCVCF